MSNPSQHQSSAFVTTAIADGERKVDPRLALGYRIKALRFQQQITQEELADRCSMFRTYMSRIESGQANPTLTMLYEIAGAFGLDIRELFTPDDTPVAARVNPKGPRTSRGRVSR